MIVTVPSSSKRMPPSSLACGAVCSRKLPKPRPRSLPRFLLSRLRLLKPLTSPSSSACLNRAGKVAAVVDVLARRLVGHFLRLDVVALADLDPVDAHLARGLIDQPLHVVIAFGPAGAAIGRDRRRVGEHELGRLLDQRCLVDADGVLHRRDGRLHRAHHRDDRRRNCRSRSCARRGNGRPCRARARSPGRGRGHACRTGTLVERSSIHFTGRPSSRVACSTQTYSGKHRRLHAERAADIAEDGVHLVGRHFEDVRRSPSSGRTRFGRRCRPCSAPLALS